VSFKVECDHCKKPVGTGVFYCVVAFDAEDPSKVVSRGPHLHWSCVGPYIMGVDVSAPTEVIRGVQVPREKLDVRPDGQVRNISIPPPPTGPPPSSPPSSGGWKLVLPE
jgi:hypothetical protein